MNVFAMCSSLSSEAAGVSTHPQWQFLELQCFSPVIPCQSLFASGYKTKPVLSKSIHISINGAELAAILKHFL